MPSAIILRRTADVNDDEAAMPVTIASPASTANISRNRLLDPRVQTTLEIMVKNRTLTVRAAMRRARFTDAESNERKCQMWIYRRLKKLGFKRERSSKKGGQSSSSKKSSPANDEEEDSQNNDRDDSEAIAALAAKARAPPQRRSQRKETRPRKKKYERSFALHPLTHANKDIHSLGGKIGTRIPRRSKASPEYIAARKAFRSASEEHAAAQSSVEAAQSAVEEARKASEEATSKFEAAELAARTAEDRYLVARSAVETLDLQTETGNSKKWNDMHARLKAYRAEHGHVRIPTKCPPEHAKLCSWTNSMRQQYRLYVTGECTSFKPHRMVLLEKMGLFVTQWQDKYNQLLEFKEQYGHCNVPTRSYKNVDERLEKLGHWVGWQRSAYKKRKDGRANTLSDERIQMLEDVGFVFNVFEDKGIVRKRKYGRNLEEEENEEGYLKQEIIEGGATNEQNNEEGAEGGVNGEEKQEEEEDSDNDAESQVIEQEEEGEGQESDDDDYKDHGEEEVDFNLLRDE